MPARTVHAESRVWERYGVAPSRADWDAAVGHIIGTVAGERRPALLLKRLPFGREEWLVRVCDTAMRVIYMPRHACIITVLPG